jgi:hypothetical protein
VEALYVPKVRILTSYNRKWIEAKSEERGWAENTI